MPDLDLTASLTRVRAWLAHRQRLRENVTPGPWYVPPRVVEPDEWARLRDEGRYVAATASPDVSAHADAGIEAWCVMVESMDGVGLFDEVALFVAWASSPLLDVPEVTP